MDYIDMRAVPGYHYYYVCPQKGAVYDSRVCAWRYPYKGFVRLSEGRKHERVHIDELIQRTFLKSYSEALEEYIRGMDEWCEKMKDINEKLHAADKEGRPRGI